MGYFRLFYYMAYIFNTICRVIKRNGKQILWVVCIFGFLIFCMWPSKSHAIYMGDYDYGDPNYALNQYYRSINIDLIKRFDTVRKTSNVNVPVLLNYITNGNYSIFLYYGNLNGSSQLNGLTYHTRNLRVLVYRNEFVNYSTITPTAYDNYNGIEPLNIISLTSNEYYIYTFAGTGLSLEESYVNVQEPRSVYIPSTLVNFYDPVFNDYFFNDTSLEELEELYNISQDLDVITDDDISAETEDTVEDAIEDIPDTFDNSYTQDIKDNEDTLLDTILTPIYTYADGTTTRRINFTLPFVDYTYQLRSDAISSRIRNTNIYTYVQLFWWFAFSIPIFMLLRRIVVWLGTGEFLNKPSRFAVFMSDFISKNITPGMM